MTEKQGLKWAFLSVSEVGGSRLYHFPIIIFLIFMSLMTIKNIRNIYRGEYKKRENSGFVSVICQRLGVLLSSSRPPQAGGRFFGSLLHGLSPAGTLGGIAGKSGGWGN
ncbi:MAG: hypothetical protein FWC64_13535 [Treponema sp.]|nr:hypothetical protein [Treponema sp.]